MKASLLVEQQGSVDMVYSIWGACAGGCFLAFPGKSNLNADDGVAVLALRNLRRAIGALKRAQGAAKIRRQAPCLSQKTPVQARLPESRYSLGEHCVCPRNTLAK